jgi:hypothetical protein
MHLQAEYRFPLEVTIDMMFNGRSGETTTFWNPWESFPAPWPWAVPPDLADFFANLWECWTTNSFTPVCHPVASKWVPGFGLSLNTPGDFDSQLRITIPGAWGASAVIQAPCNPWAPPFPLLNIEDATLVYTQGQAKPTWTFHPPASSYVCPRPFQEPPGPEFTRPPPPSNYSNDYKYEGTVGLGDDAKHIGLNLKKIREITDNLILGAGDYYHRAQLHYSPWDPVGCPEGKNCTVYAKESANVWKCTGYNYSECFPVADRRYGLTFGFINISDPLTGLQVSYAGGVLGSTTTVHYHCDPEGMFGVIMFPASGSENSQFGPQGYPRHIVVMAHTRELCEEIEWGELHGGAVFLLLLFGGCILYFGFGPLGIFLGTGALSIPNEGFWLALWDSVYTAIQFIVTCGKSANAGPVYDRV